MGPKKNKIKEERNLRNQKNARRWTDVELDAYVDVLADVLAFAATLDKLARKKSSNNEIFGYRARSIAPF